MLRAVLFDLDNTLVDRDGAFRACVAAVFPDPAAREELGRLDGNGHGDRAALVAAWAARGGGAVTLLELGCRIASRIVPQPGLTKALVSLKARIEIGLITNGTRTVQERKLAAAGLDKVFDAHRVWVSGDVGVAKPDPAIFLLASRALNVPPAECLFIGDREEIDSVGAIAAGMRARRVGAVLDGATLAELLDQEGLMGPEWSPRRAGLDLAKAVPSP